MEDAIQPEVLHGLLFLPCGMVLVNALGDLAERCRWLRPRQAIVVVVGGWVISFAVGSLFLL
jgi:hypothetical protein